MRAASLQNPALLPWSDRDLRADLDGATRRDMKIFARVIRRPGKKNKEPVLPARHPGVRRRPQTSPRQKKRRTHHIEFETMAAAGRQGDRDVCTLHVSKPH